MSEHGAKQLIGSAERHIAERKFDLALEELARANKLDPKNNYVGAIIDRVHNLQETAMTDESKSRYLSVTVGSQYPGGVKGDESLQPSALSECRAHIKSLTRMAEYQLKDGSIANAFDSLMDAYLLDPNNPDVLATEKRVLPAWQEVNSNPERRAQLTERWRLEVLKQQKDLERREKERSMWRQASKPLSVMKDVESSRPVNMPPNQAPDPLDTHKVERGLFSKLKLGKFLG